MECDDDDDDADVVQDHHCLQSGIAFTLSPALNGKRGTVCQHDAKQTGRVQQAMCIEAKGKCILRVDQCIVLYFDFSIGLIHRICNG